MKDIEQMFKNILNEDKAIEDNYANNIFLTTTFNMTNTVGYHSKDLLSFLDDVSNYFMSNNVETLTLQGDDPELSKLLLELKADANKTKLGVGRDEGRVIIIKEAGFIRYEDGKTVKNVMNSIYGSEYYLVIVGGKKSNWGGTKKHMLVL